MGCSPPGSSVHGILQARILGVGCHSLLQGTFLTQRSNPGLSHCTRILYCLSQQGSPRILEWGAYPFSRGTSQPRDRTMVFCTAGRFFTSWATKALGGGKNGKLLFKVYGVSVLQDEKVTETGCKTMWINLTLLNCTFKTVNVCYGNSRVAPQEIKTRTSRWFSNIKSGYTSKGNRIIISKRQLHFHIHCSLIHSSQGYRNDLRVHGQRNGLRKCGIWIQWNIIQPVICNNMNEPAGYHATRNKPQRETQILDAITPEWNMKTNKIKDHRSKRVGKWLPKAERVGK